MRAFTRIRGWRTVVHNLVLNLTITFMLAVAALMGFTFGLSIKDWPCCQTECCFWLYLPLSNMAHGSPFCCAKYVRRKSKKVSSVETLKETREVSWLFYHQYAMRESLRCLWVLFDFFTETSDRRRTIDNLSVIRYSVSRHAKRFGWVWEPRVLKPWEPSAGILGVFMTNDTAED